MMGNFMVRDLEGVLSRLTGQVAVGNHYEAVVRSPGTWPHGIQGFKQLKKAEKGQKGTFILLSKQAHLEIDFENHSEAVLASFGNCQCLVNFFKGKLKASTAEKGRMWSGLIK